MRLNDQNPESWILLYQRNPENYLFVHEIFEDAPFQPMQISGHINHNEQPLEDLLEVSAAFMCVHSTSMRALSRLLCWLVLLFVGRCDSFAIRCVLVSSPRYILP